MTLHYLTTALKSLRKNKFYSALSIGGFAVGFSICIIIGLYAYQEFTTDRSFPNTENVYRLVDADMRDASLSTNNSNQLNRDFPEIEVALPYGFSVNGELYCEDEQYKSKGDIICTNDFFEVFSIEVISKLGDKPFVDEASIVLTESFATTIFGDENPLGKIVYNKWYSGEVQNYTVTAVVKDMPSNTSMPASYFIPQSFKKNYSTFIFIKLHKYTDKDILLKQISDEIKESGWQENLCLQAFTDIYFDTTTTERDAHLKGNKSLIMMLVSIAFLILLLSIINYVNYSISKYRSRLRSVSIRKINGARFTDLFRYDLSESLICTLSALFMAVLLAQWFMPLSQELLGREFGLEVLFERLPFLIFILTTVFIIVLNTVIPLWSILRFDVLSYLQSDVSQRRSIVTTILSSVQFGIAILVFVFLLFVNKQLHYVKHSSLGFNAENIICLYSIPRERTSPVVLKTEVDKLPFVNMSSLSSMLPMRWAGQSMFYGYANGKKTVTRERRVNADYNFFETYGLSLVEGRSLRKGDEGKAVIVNEKWVKDRAWDNCEGKTIGQSVHPPSVVGVMKDFHFESFHKEIDILAIVCRKMDGTEKRVNASSLSIRLAPGVLSEQIDKMREVWTSIYPEVDMRFSFEDEYFQTLYEEDERLSKGISIFSFLAFMLVLLGVLGQVFQLCINKTKEIGIRKANGATLLDVFILVSYSYVKWLLVAFVIVTPISYLLTQKWLENFAYKTPLSWWVFALAGFGTLVFVVGVVTLQSWKTARRNPVEALRYE